MAKYKKRKDGRYHTSITLDGKKYELYSKSIKELDKKVIELRVKYEQGLMLKSPTILFKDYKERYNVENCFELFKMFNIKTKTDEKGLYFIIED